MMNILFLTIGRMGSIEDHGIYPDLLRYFRDKGHNVYTVSPYEKRTGLNTELKNENGVKMLHVRIGNIIKCGMIEKGISTLQIEGLFLKAIKRYYADVKFDLVLYSTPPITFAKVIRYIKKRDGAKTYLMLKDIFPQNAVDIGIMQTTGFKGLIYKYFRKKEKNLYDVSDRIGCMSKANVDYVLKHNQEISPEKVEVCPNCIEVQEMRLSGQERRIMRDKYHIPQDKMVFVYGGNLGKPQGIPFIIKCLKSQEKNKEAYFLVVGDGTEYNKLKSYFDKSKPANMKLMSNLPKDDYDRMIAACDVGMIFLDHRFTIPNFPSRLLSYMQAGLPVLACTDPNTDIGRVITEGEFGWWIASDNCKKFSKIIDLICNEELSSRSDNSYEFLKQHYPVSEAYNIIMSSV